LTHSCRSGRIRDSHYPQGKPPKGGTEATDWTDTAERGLATLLCDCVLPGRSIIRLDKSKDDLHTNVN
jgi:hypothetical protein